MKSNAAIEYATKKILSIHDITNYVLDQKRLVDAKKIDQIRLPEEHFYSVDVILQKRYIYGALARLFSWCACAPLFLVRLRASSSGALARLRFLLVRVRAFLISWCACAPFFSWCVSSFLLRASLSEIFQYNFCVTTAIFYAQL